MDDANIHHPKCALVRPHVGQKCSWPEKQQSLVMHFREMHGEYSWPSSEKGDGRDREYERVELEPEVAPATSPVAHYAIAVHLQKHGSGSISLHVRPGSMGRAEAILDALEHVQKEYSDYAIAQWLVDEIPA